MQSQENISIITHGESFFAKSLEWFKKNGLGTSPGPLAVERNLLSGLKKINANFTLNPNLGKRNKYFAFLRNFKSFSKIESLKERNGIWTVGPNFSAEELGFIAKKFKTVDFFLAPSEEVKKTYGYYGVGVEKIIVWPVGIDTVKYYDTSFEEKKVDALIYFKNRKNQELSEVVAMLKHFKQSYLLLKYGQYTENEFIRVLKISKYAVVLNHTESQGIAVQSIMSANLPIFVFDQIYQGNSPSSFLREVLKPSSVPYWSEKCGVKIPTDFYSLSKLKFYKIPECAQEFENFLANIRNFFPREFIMENLTLESQAEKFCKIFYDSKTEKFT